MDAPEIKYVKKGEGENVIEVKAPMGVGKPLHIEIPEGWEVVPEGEEIDTTCLFLQGGLLGLSAEDPAWLQNEFVGTAHAPGLYLRLAQKDS